MGIRMIDKLSGTITITRDGAMLDHPSKLKRYFNVPCPVCHNLIEVESSKNGRCDWVGCPSCRTELSIVVNMVDGEATFTLLVR